jgi:hypothetical protein
MILGKTPQYDKNDLKSIITALIDELRLFGVFKYKLPDENTNEEELRTLYNELRHRLLEEAFYRMYSYVSQFPFDDLFMDEKDMLRYLLKHLEETS